jgi:hypothetical protein
MSSNILPPRASRPRRKRPSMAVVTPPPEPIGQPAAMGARPPRKTNIGDQMRKKNRRLSMPKV